MTKGKRKDSRQKNLKGGSTSSNKRSTELTDEELGKISAGGVSARTSAKTGGRD
jgi:hypothetical protein